MDFASTWVRIPLPPFGFVWPINIWSGCVQVRGAGGRGRVAEWLKAHDWKSCGLTPAWVRIPPRPCWDDPFRFRGVAQSGRALRSGRRGPRFESGRPDYVGRFSDLLEERWQNGIALASKASARKGLGVRIPRAPFMGPQRPSYPSS